MRNHFSKIMTTVRHLLQNESFKEQYRMQNNYFTKDRKLGFGEICTMIIRGTKNGLQAGINEFLKEINTDVNGYSKAAYCKARQRIHPDAFKALVDLTVQEFYKENKAKTRNGYRILAIDGSDLNLPNTQSLLETFGSEHFAHGVQVQAQVSCMYDVLNKTDKDLILMDRGYPSEELLHFLEKNGYIYLMRANKKEFFREVRDTVGDDETVYRKCKNGEELKIRVISFLLPNGTKETLLTNLFDGALINGDFADLYRLRWGIETKYDDLKNKLELEKFSGVSPVCIYQDFYATLFLSNLLAFLELDHQKELEKINASPSLKHTYKVNTTLAVQSLRSNVAEILMVSSKRRYYQALYQIQSSLKQCLTPIRPGRSFPRVVKHPALKHS